jgi:hypothetical protein
MATKTIVKPKKNIEKNPEKIKARSKLKKTTLKNKHICSLFSSPFSVDPRAARRSRVQPRGRGGRHPVAAAVLLHRRPRAVHTTAQVQSLRSDKSRFKSPFMYICTLVRLDLVRSIRRSPEPIRTTTSEFTTKTPACT